MSTMYASLFPEEHLKNLILLATPTDFAPDHPDLMTEAFRRWIRGFYQNNTLPKVETELRGQRVGLSTIDCPLLNIAGSKDFICPLGQADATMDLTSSQDKEFAVFNAGTRA
jgi:poly(3-hydroxyalkanoate) synthetase